MVVATEPGSGKLERGDGVLVLAGDPQPSSAGREHLEQRTLGEQMRDERRRRQEVLEVVEQEEEPTAPEERLQLLQEGLVSLLADVQLLRDGGCDQRRVGERTKRDEADAVAELRAEVG